VGEVQEVSVELIVVGVDGSKGADRAVRWSAELAIETSARVLAVFAVPRVETWNRAVLVTDTGLIARQLRALLRGPWTEPLRQAGVAHKTRVVRGDPAEQLLRVADERDADVIVIGAKSHGNLHDVILGGTAHKVANSTHRPVVLVPTPTPTNAS